MTKIKNNISNILYIFILISPFLDTLSYLMREILNLDLSLSTILKPLIIGLVYIYLIGYLVFKKKKKLVILPMVLTLIYIAVHLILIKNMFFDFSYSTFATEISRMIQVVYLMMVLSIFLIIYRNKKEFNFNSDTLIKVIALSGVIYYILYFASIVTQTSSLSYSNNRNYGYQGWLVPSHLINHLGSLIIPLVWLQYKKSRKMPWLYAFGLMCALCFIFIGTKSSTYSVLIIVTLLFIYEFLNCILHFNKKNLYPLLILTILLIGCRATYKYTYTYKNTELMNKYLNSLKGNISDKNKNTLNNIINEENNEQKPTNNKPNGNKVNPGGTSNNKIPGNNTGNNNNTPPVEPPKENKEPTDNTNEEINNKVDKKTQARKDYIANAKESMLYLKKITLERDLSGADNRTNEAIYNSKLFSLLPLKYKLFGIGYSNQPNNLYMENDIYASLFNHGILSFLLVLSFFIVSYIYCLIKMLGEFLKGKLFKNGEAYIMLISMSLFLVLSYTTGYMLYQTSLIIVFIPIFIHCVYLLNNEETINLKYRLRKYASKIMRLKNKKEYQKELEKRDNLTIFDYKELSKDMPISSSEISKDNTLYGIAEALREYTEYQGLLDSYIEHGVNFTSSVYPKEATSGLSNIIAVSKRRIKIINNNYKKRVYAIGPYIHYATPLYDEEQYKKDKKKLGKVLLVFPTKSIQGVNHEFDASEFIKEIKEVKKKTKSDTVLVNIYYYDLQQGMQEQFEKEGFKIVTAGHKNDIHFTKRLKYIISLADYTMSNNMGTHIGYCIYMNKPHYIYEQKINITGENVKEEFYEERLRTYNESQEKIIKAFSKFSEEITKEQKELYEEHWDPKSIKTKEELLEILQDSEYGKNEEN